MKYTGLIQKTTVFPPTYNQWFWKLQIHWLDEIVNDTGALPTESYSLNDIFWFNSQTDQNFMTMFAQVGTPIYMWTPEDEVFNTESELFRKYADLLILNQVRFVDFIDGNFLVVNDDKIAQWLESNQLSTAAGMEAAK